MKHVGVDQGGAKYEDREILNFTDSNQLGNLLDFSLYTEPDPGG